MEPTHISRRVYPGAPVRRGYRVTSIKCVPNKEDQVPQELVSVGDIDSYSKGCPLHKGCFGHMCMTSSGLLLPPHSFSFRSGDIRTIYYEAATLAFSDMIPEYIQKLKTTGYKKAGTVRSILATPVSGCARLVAIPHNDPNPAVVFLSSNLASKIRYCYYDETEEGVESVYKERTLTEGDYVMLERPPSLTKYNNQPLRVITSGWHKEALGVHPIIFKFFHGDYDGDEAHIYVLRSPNSIAEAQQWKYPEFDDFNKARDMYRELQQSHWDLGAGDMSFMEHSTLSFNQIMNNDTQLLYGNEVRCKDPHLRLFSERMRFPRGTETFLGESLAGVEDIKRQQLSQGTIGDMSRVARIVASCIYRNPGGGTTVLTRDGPVKLDPNTSPSYGCPAVRCVMLLCSVAQQSALDAHRVGSTASAGIDLVSNLLRGRDAYKAPEDFDTICVCTNQPIVDGSSVKWRMQMDDKWICVVKTSALRKGALDILGCYDPVLLGWLPKSQRRDACMISLNVVFNYYGICVEGDDAQDLVTLMTYRCEDSIYPITTRPGMLARDLSWIETLCATDYTKMSQLTNSVSYAYSSTSASYMSNFSNL